MPLWEGAYYSTLVAGAVLHLAELPAAPMPSYFPGSGAPVGTSVPPSPSVCKHSSAAPALAPAQSQGPAVVPGLSLERRGYKHMNHSLEKEKLQAIKQGGKLKVFTFLCLLCLNFSLKNLALFFQVFLQLCWRSRAVVSQASLESDTLS